MVDLLDVVPGRSWNYANSPMDTYPLRKLFRLLQLHGIDTVHIDATDHGKRGLLLFFRKD